MIEDLERLRQRCMDMARQIVEPKEWSEEWARYATVLQIIILEKSEPTFLCVSQKTHDAVCTENDSLAVQLEDMTNDRIHYQRELAMAEKERDEARAQAYQPPAKLIHMERDALAAQLKERTKERDSLREALQNVVDEGGHATSGRCLDAVRIIALDALKQQKGKEGDEPCAQENRKSSMDQPDETPSSASNAESHTSDPLASATPRTERKIALAFEDHKNAGFDDFQHYMALCGDLAAFARQLEQELTAAKADRDAWCNSFHAANKERLAARAIGTTRV